MTLCPALKCNLNKALSPRKIGTSEIRELEGQDDSRLSAVGTRTQRGASSQTPNAMSTRLRLRGRCLPDPPQGTAG